MMPIAPRYVGYLTVDYRENYPPQGNWSYTDLVVFYFEIGISTFLTDWSKAQERYYDVTYTLTFMRGYVIAESRQDTQLYPRLALQVEGVWLQNINLKRN